MEEKRAYSQAQFQALGIDTDDYKFNQQAGTFTAILDIKVWGNNKNVLAFFTVDDGRKFIASVPDFKGFFGLPDIPLGTKLELTYAPNKKGKVYITEIQRLDRE